MFLNLIVWAQKPAIPSQLPPPAPPFECKTHFIMTRMSSIYQKMGLKTFHLSSPHTDPTQQWVGLEMDRKPSACFFSHLLEILLCSTSESRFEKFFWEEHNWKGKLLKREWYIWLYGLKMLVTLFFGQKVPFGKKIFRDRNTITHKHTFPHSYFFPHAINA